METERMDSRILIISPVRNEADYIEQTLSSMVKQSIRPTKWIIVDDGSADATAEIIERFTLIHPWIELKRKPDRGARAVGPGVVEAFYFGLGDIDPLEYDFICKLDGDISFGESYFSTLLKKFEADPKLGGASGKPYIVVNGVRHPERTNDEMVAGQMNFFRSQCFVDSGGFVRQVHWDAIVFHRARMAGWKTRSFSEPALDFHHLRLMGSSHKSVYVGRLRWGRGQYFLGTHPLYIFAIGIYRAMETPYIIGGLLIVTGYFQAMLTKHPRYEHPGFRKSLHDWQLKRLKLR